MHHWGFLYHSSGFILYATFIWHPRVLILTGHNPYSIKVSQQKIHFKRDLSDTDIKQILNVYTKISMIIKNLKF